MTKTSLRSLAFWLGISLSIPAIASEVLPPSTEGTLTAPDGARLYYRIVGTGDRTIVIPVAYWNIARFERHGDLFRFLFYDPRNRGRSEAFDLSQISLEGDLEDLEAVRKHFDLERISLIGSSYYGGLAALYAARNPQRVDKLVMVGPISPRAKLLYSYDPPEKKALIDPGELERLARLNDTEKDRTRYCREHWKVHGIKYVGDPAAVPFLGLLCDLPNEWPERISPWAAALLGGMGDWNWLPEARRVRAPTLVIHGRRDLVVPLEGSEEWHRELPESRLLILEKAGHADWFGAADELFPAVLGFLAEPPARLPGAPKLPPPSP